MRFSFPHSHAFAGGRVLIEDADENEGPCAVEFGDGVSIIGEWRRTADGIYLEVPVYRTAKGTEVVARSWRLKHGEDGCVAFSARRLRSADANDLGRIALKATSREASSSGRNR